MRWAGTGLGRAGTTVEPIVEALQSGQTGQRVWERFHSDKARGEISRRVSAEWLGGSRVPSDPPDGVPNGTAGGGAGSVGVPAARCHGRSASLDSKPPTAPSGDPKLSCPLTGGGASATVRARTVYRTSFGISNDGVGWTHAHRAHAHRAHRVLRALSCAAYPEGRPGRPTACHAQRTTFRALGAHQAHGEHQAHTERVERTKRSRSAADPQHATSAPSTSHARNTPTLRGASNAPKPPAPQERRAVLAPGGSRHTEGST